MLMSGLANKLKVADAGGIEAVVAAMIAHAGVQETGCCMYPGRWGIGYDEDTLRKVHYKGTVEDMLRNRTATSIVAQGI